MRKKIHAHLDKMADEALAAGLTYGKYVAQKTHPVVVDVPAYLKYAPTMFERLAGAVPPPAPEWEKKAQRKTEKKIQGEKIPAGYVEAKWLKPKRRAAKLTTAAMAELCGIHRNTLVSWETAERMPIGMLERVTKVLDDKINYPDGK